MKLVGDIYAKKYGRSRDIQGSSLFRADWRWGRVCELSAMRETAARVRLEEINDLGVTSAYEFKTFRDRELDVGEEYSCIKNAYTLFTEAPGLRSSLEAYLLCSDIEVEDILSKWTQGNEAGLKLGDIYAYTETFFDVRGILNKPEWICTLLFGDILGLIRDISNTSRLGEHHRAGWLLGSKILETYVDPKGALQTTMKGGALREALASQIEEIAYRQTLISSFCKTRGDERSLETMRSVLMMIKDRAIHALGGVGTGDTNADAVMTFLQEIPFSVANPSLEANKQLPAREARVHEMIRTVEATVLEETSV
jgi:hypothetical protein